MARSQSVFTGNPEEVIGWLQSFVNVGVETIVIRFGSPDQSAQLELCGKQVLPYVKN